MQMTKSMQNNTVCKCVVNVEESGLRLCIMDTLNQVYSRPGSYSTTKAK